MFSSLAIMDSCCRYLFAPTEAPYRFNLTVDESPPPKGQLTKAIEEIPLMCLDGSSINYIPARYEIPSVAYHFYPVAGIYVDPRIMPGLKYRVRRLPNPRNGHYNHSDYLFDGHALRLNSIGRGYCRRLTFQSTTSCNENENYFWADSHESGFVFELVVVQPGDIFEALDETSGIVQGSLEVIEILGPQIEIAEIITENRVLKKVMVKILCKNSKGIMLAINGMVHCTIKKPLREYIISKITMKDLKTILVPAKKRYSA